MQALAATRNAESRSHRTQWIMVIAYLLTTAIAGTVMAQDDAAKPKPRKVALKTKDGVELRAFYFPSDRGKEAVTVLLVHEWQGQASPYSKLVLALRDAGCAVLVPDYRGHGGSRDYVNQRGQDDQFNIATMNKRDIENIVSFDLEKAKAFLKEENDEERLNLNALVVIGVREGCILGAHWTQRDWSFPSVGSMKQGQDVKALVLISPRKQIKGIGIDPVISNPTIVNLPIMVVAGGAGPDASEARRLVKRVESYKTRIGRGQASGLEVKYLKTNLSGPSLVNEVSSVIPSIVKFIKENVEISDDTNEWIKRD
ncbi:MAG: alpha/beta hydrolase [Rubripirellula sp.]